MRAGVNIVRSFISDENSGWKGLVLQRYWKVPLILILVGAALTTALTQHARIEDRKYALLNNPKLQNSRITESDLANFDDQTIKAIAWSMSSAMGWALLDVLYFTAGLTLMGMLFLPEPGFQKILSIVSVAMLFPYFVAAFIHIPLANYLNSDFAAHLSLAAILVDLAEIHWTSYAIDQIDVFLLVSLLLMASGLQSAFKVRFITCLSAVGLIWAIKVTFVSIHLFFLLS